jgi:BirA family biotin operon repressor/biotin-[acetyl-CoA-carboxylase] ligase
MSVLPPWNDQAVQALTSHVRRLCPDAGIEVVAHIDSTNSELMRRGHGRDNPPTLLVALSQSAGRGRMGRAWQSQPGAGLTFSWGMHLAPTDWSGLSLAVGLALVDALDPDGQWGLQLKWPNDLCWQSAGAVRKLGGILIETQMAAASAETPARRWCVVGVGLNLQTPDIDGAGLAPVGWREITGETTSPGPDLLQACMTTLVPAMQAFELHGFGPLAERFAQRDALRGQTVVLSDGRSGTAQGVDAQGALRVLTAQGPETVHSAEVSVRPIAAQGANHV